MVDVIEDTFSVEGEPRLVVANEVGDIDVASGEGGAIGIRSTLDEADRTDYRVRQEGGTVYVEAKRKRTGLLGRVLGRECRVDISVEVPKQTGVELETVVGDVQLRDVKGPCKLGTVNGKLLVHSVEGDLSASVVNGRLVLTDVKGAFEGSTVNGGIVFEGEMVPGSENRFSTVNGDVRVSLQGPTRVNVEASTVNGDFSSRERATAEDGGEADLVVTTVNGSVTVH